MPIANWFMGMDQWLKTGSLRSHNPSHNVNVNIHTAGNTEQILSAVTDCKFSSSVLHEMKFLQM